MSDQIQITTPHETLETRNTCGSCASAEKIAGGHTICRRNPPGRSAGGGSIWPPVSPATDWCMQWTGREPSN